MTKKLFKIACLSVLGYGALSSCGTEDSAEELITSGDITASCLIDAGEIKNCSEYRDISSSFAEQIVNNCNEQADAALGRQEACPNREEAFGYCERTTAEGYKTFDYQSGDNLTAEDAEAFCNGDTDIWVPQ